MTFFAKVGSFDTTSGAAGGTVQITGLGFQAKAVVFYWGGQTASVDACGTINAFAGMGVAIGSTNRHTFGVGIKNNAGTTDVESWRRSNQVICASDGSVYDGHLDFWSFGSTSISLGIDDAFVTSRRISYLAIGGTDITNVASGSGTAPAATGNQDITGLGFQPDAVLVFGGFANGTATYGNSAGGAFFVGAASGTAEQGVVAFASRDNAGSAVSSGYSYPGEIIVRPSVVGGSSCEARAEFVSFLADGFRINWLETSGTAYLRFYYLAIKGGQWKVGNTSTRTDATPWDITPGFAVSVGFLFSSCRAQSTQDTLTAPASLSLGAFTSPSERAACAIRDANGADPTEVAAAIEHDEVYARISSGETIDGLMDVSGTASTTVSLVMDNADPDAAQVFYFVGGGTALAGTAPISITVNSSSGASCAIDTGTSGTAYYLDSASGSDANDGLGTASAWQNFSKLLTVSLGPGDSINLKRGSSWNQKLTVSTSGLSGSPITIQPYGSGTAFPVIAYTGATYDECLRADGNWLVVDGIKFTSQHEGGIRTGGTAITIQNCEFEDVGWGVNIRSSGITVDNCYFHDLHIIVNTTSPTTDDYGALGVNINGTISDIVITNNTFINCRDASYDYGYDGGATEVYGSVTDCEIAYNYARGCQGFFESGSDGTGVLTNLSIHHNISDRNYSHFSLFRPAGSRATQCVNVKVEHNTIAFSSSAYRVFETQYTSAGTPGSNLVFRSNIVYGEEPLFRSTEGHFDHDYNLAYCYGDALVQDPVYDGFGTQLHAHDLLDDPEFVNPGLYDYHLLSTSPAISMGIDLGYSLDYDSQPIPQGTGYDVGAYEFDTPTSVELGLTVVDPFASTLALDVYHPGGSVQPSISVVSYSGATLSLNVPRAIPSRFGGTAHLYFSFSTQVAQSPSWEEESGYCLAVHTHRGRQLELDRFEAGVATFTLNNSTGRFNPVNSSGPHYGQILPMKRVRLAVEHGGATYNVFTGYVEAWPQEREEGCESWCRVECVDGFKVFSLCHLDGTALPEENSGSRVDRVLDIAGWPVSERTVAVGQSNIQAGTVTDYIQSHLQAVAVEAENGRFFIDRGGTAVFQDRHAPISPPYTTSQGTVANYGSYMPFEDVELAYDDATLWNRVVVSRSGGGTATATDTSSTANYYTRTLYRSGLLVTTDNELSDVSNWWVGKYANPGIRVRKVVLAPQMDSRLWAFVLGRELGDRVTIFAKAPDGSQVTQDVFVESIDHDIDADRGTWRVTWMLSPADSANYWILGTGVLGTDTKLGY